MEYSDDNEITHIPNIANTFSRWLDAADLAWVVFARGTVCDSSRAVVQVFEDHLLTLDDQLTDTACAVAISNKNFTKKGIFSLLVQTK